MARPRRTWEQTAASFWDRVAKQDNGCWLWQGSKIQQTGYGELRVWGKRWTAHRFSWLVAHGDPGEMHVLHTCPGGDNKLCVNPAHLRLGTERENAHDAMQRSERNRGERNGMSRLTIDDVRAIRAEYQRGVFGYIRLGKKYGVSGGCILKIITRRGWQHV